MTFDKEVFSTDISLPKMLRGAGIARYAMPLKMSQGEQLFVDEMKLKARESMRELMASERIVLQGITGVNEKWRIKATLAKNVYCANSANYILVGGSKARVLLGILNSRLMNFFFSKFSTNSNVNGYEVDVLPVFPNVTPEQQSRIIKFVDSVLAAKKRNPAADTSALEREIDKLVYRLYGLTDDEIRVIEETNGGEDVVATQGGGRGAPALPDGHRTGVTLPNDGRARSPSAPKDGDMKKKRKPKFEEEF